MWLHTSAETSSAAWQIIVNYCYPIENALRGRGENRGVIGEGDPDRHQNLIDCSLGHAPPLQKFHQNPFIPFWDSRTERLTLSYWPVRKWSPRRRQWEWYSARKSLNTTSDCADLSLQREHGSVRLPGSRHEMASQQHRYQGERSEHEAHQGRADCWSVGEQGCHQMRPAETKRAPAYRQGRARQPDRLRAEIPATASVRVRDDDVVQSRERSQRHLRGQPTSTFILVNS